MNDYTTSGAQEIAKILLKAQDTVFNSVILYQDLYIKTTTGMGKRSPEEVDFIVNALEDSLNTCRRVLENIEPKIDKLPPSSVQECLAIHCYTALSVVMGYAHSGIPALRRTVKIAFGQASREDTGLDMKMYLRDLTQLPDSPEVDYSGVYSCKAKGLLYLNVVYEQDIMVSEDPTEDGF